MKIKKAAFVVVILSALCLLGWTIYQKRDRFRLSLNKEPRKAPVTVEISPVRKADIRDRISLTGTLQAWSSFILAPKIAGRLEKIWVNIGDTVKVGQLVAVLDDEEYRQQVNQARAEMEVAQANLLEWESALENAKREFARTVELRKKKIASESQLDASESEYKTQQAKIKVALAQVAQKMAALKAAEARLSYARIQIGENNASSCQVVGERFVDEGSMLAPNTPIVSILDIGKLIAVVHVIERDYHKVHIGMEAIITTDALREMSFTGKVARIAPLLKEQSREARIEIEVPNDRLLLKPGMFITAEILFAIHENATVIPKAALMKREGLQGVFMADLKEEKAHFVPVKVGITDESLIEILQPPLAGSIVTLGQHLLEDGASIIVHEKEAVQDIIQKGKSEDIRENPLPSGKQPS